MPIIEIPKNLLCPLSHKLFRDPVAASDGQVYSHNKILEWMAESNTSPITHKKFPNKKLTPIGALQSVVQEFQNSIIPERHFLKLIKSKNSKELQEAKYYASYFNASVLKEAIESQDVEIVSWVVDHGRLNVNERTEPWASPLHLASKRGNLDIIRFLISRGANLECASSKGKTPLLYSANCEVAKCLVRAGANSDIQTKDTSLVMHAVIQEDLEMLQWACEEEGVNIHFTDSSGRTPLHFCFNSPRGAACACFLIKEGIDVNIQENRNRNTALHIACMKEFDCFDVVVSLLEAGASVDIKNDKGNTPLHWAVRKMDEAKILLNFGANLIAVNEEGATPLQGATPEQTKELVEFYEQHSATTQSSEDNEEETKEMSEPAAQSTLETIQKNLLDMSQKVSTLQSEVREVMQHITKKRRTSW